jgi:hypothetical protein
VDANQPFEIGPVPPTSLHGSREPSTVDGGTGRDGGLMIECPGWVAKKVKSQAQRGRMSKEVRAMDRWEQSPTYAASQDPQEVGRSPFQGQRSRSQNRSPCERGEECPQRLKTVKACRKSLKRVLWARADFTALGAAAGTQPRPPRIPAIDRQQFIL